MTDRYGTTWCSVSCVCGDCLKADKQMFIATESANLRDALRWIAEEL